MIRPSLKCAHCGNNDLEASISSVPSAICLECPVCGHLTYIAFLDDKGKPYTINTPTDYSLFEETHYRQVTYKEISEKKTESGDWK